jgi:secretion/DNA translocation related TadE-like protein
MRTGESGSVSVVTAALIAVLLVCTMGVADLGRALAARAQARAAADAAALAAVQEQVFPQGAVPAQVAADIAARNGATLVDCECSPGALEAVVTVRRSFGPLLLVPGTLSVDVRARAVADTGG